MDTIHEQRSVHEKQLFGLEQAVCTRGNSSEQEGRHSYWNDDEAQDSADNTEGVGLEGKEKTQGSEKKKQRRTVWLCGTQRRTPRNR